MSARGAWVALSGTPGVGKTRLARALRRAGFQVVDGNAWARRVGAVVGRDRHRGSAIVDLARLGRAVRAWPARDTVRVLDAHWSHEVPGIRRALVLRARPALVRRRLRARGWPEPKIQENVEAEAMGIIAGEARHRFSSAAAAELDASDLSTTQVLGRVRTFLAGAPRVTKLEIGRVDWSEEILGWF